MTTAIRAGRLPPRRSAAVEAVGEEAVGQFERADVGGRSNHARIAFTAPLERQRGVVAAGVDRT
jgi:hypothetical protein